MPQSKLDPNVMENASNMCRTASRLLLRLADNLRNPDLAKPGENDRLRSQALSNLYAVEARLK